MATMISTTRPAETQSLANERVITLRDWLRDHWCAVFSNPDDFALDASTPAGFLTCVADEIRVARIKPIAFVRSLEPPPSTWLDHAVNDDALIVLNRNSDIIDLAEHTLGTVLATLKQPFVVIVDDLARVRMTLKYSPGDRSRSILDIVDTIGILRESESGRWPDRQSGQSMIRAAAARSPCDSRPSLSG